jgi:predicted Zn-ribbon and HTH transcriptional regulator
MNTWTEFQRRNLKKWGAEPVTKEKVTGDETPFSSPVAKDEKRVNLVVCPLCGFKDREDTIKRYGMCYTCYEGGAE